MRIGISLAFVLVVGLHLTSTQNTSSKSTAGSTTKGLQITTSANNNTAAYVSDAPPTPPSNGTAPVSDGDTGFPGWGIAIIIIVLILVIGAIVAVLVYFLVIKKKGQNGDVTKNTSASKTNKDESSSSGGLKLPSLSKKKNTLPPIDNSKKSKPKDTPATKDESRYTLSTEGNWRASQRRGEDNKSYNSPEKPSYKNNSEKPESHIASGDLSRGIPRDSRGSYREGEERPSGPVPRHDLEEEGRKLERGESQKFGKYPNEKERDEEDNF